MSAPAGQPPTLLLGRRLTLVAAAIASVLAAGYILIGVWFAKIQLEREFRDHAEMAAASLASTLIEAILTHNLHKVPGLLDSAQRSNQSLKYAFVCDHEGNPVASAGSFETGVPADLITFVRARALDKAVSRSWVIRANDEDLLHLSYHLAGRPGGYLEMGFSLEQVDQRLAVTFRHLVSSMLLGLLLSAIGGGLIYRRMAQPIGELTEAVAGLGAGDLSRRATLAEGDEDEVAVLGRAFNRMAGQLEDKLNQLTRSRSELAEEKTRIQAILDGMMHGVIFYDPQGDIAYLNSTARMQWGLDALARPRRAQDVHPGPGKALAAFHRVFSGAAEAAHARERRGGRIIDVFVSTLRKDDGGLLGEIELTVDITEQEAQARSLAHAEKLNVVGQLASGVAHEINSPLDGAIEAAKLISGGGLKEGEIRDFARAQQAALERIAAIIKRLLTFSRREGGPTARVKVMELAADSVELIRHRLARAQVEVSMPDPGQAPALVEAEPLEISQVMVNLLANAIDASPPGGKINIEARSENGKVTVSISDQGPGIAEADQGRVFTPFFTTKEVGKGTGLGLAISKNIVENCGGRIEFENGPPPWGATFRVILPAAAPDEDIATARENGKDARP